MRVLFVHELAGFFGGVEQNVFDTAKALSARGHDCFYSAREATGRDPERFMEVFADSQIGWSGRSPSPDEVQNLVERWGCQTIYVHKSPDTRFVPELHGVRTVRAIHDHDVTCPRRHKYYARTSRCCDRPISWFCYVDLAFLDRKKIDLGRIARVLAEVKRQTRFDLVIANSSSMASELRINGVPSEKIQVIHPVVPALSETVQPLPADPHVLFVGQLIRGKGVDLLLRAMALVDVPWKLTIVGTGNMQPELESLIDSLKIREHVTMAGWTPAEQVRKLYDTARVVAVPIRWPEPFGMVGIEAMRRGRPVVAFALGGVLDWLEDGVTGRLVPEQDLNAYAKAIAALLSDNESAQRMGTQAVKVAQERFGFENYIDKLEVALQGSA